jgi:hypothetical protein
MRFHRLGNHFYADDSQIYMMFKPINISARTGTLTRVETGIHDVRKWLRQNMLKLNDEKTEVITFKSRHRVDSFDRASVKIGDIVAESESCVRNLGVWLDEMLTMEKQVNSISKSAYMHLRNIGRIRRYLTSDATKSLIHASVTSRLDYCNTLLYGLPCTLINKLQRVQNTGARIITRSSRHDHIRPVLKDLHWLPISRRIDYKMLMLTWKALHGFAPTYIVDLLEVYTSSRSLRSTSVVSLVVPRSKTRSYGGRSLRCAAASLWNALPSQLKDIATQESFRRSLRTHLFVLERMIVRQLKLYTIICFSM